MGEIITLEEFRILKPIECPSRGGINFPCAICRECEIGAVTQTFEENMLIESTVNSVLIHINLDLGDEFERFVLKRLKSELSKNIPQVQKGDWDEGDITILVDDALSQNEESLKKIEWLLWYLPNKWKQLAISAKQVFSKWENQTVKQIVFQFEKVK